MSNYVNNWAMWLGVTLALCSTVIIIMLKLLIDQYSPSFWNYILMGIIWVPMFLMSVMLIGIGIRNGNGKGV
jgi:hypothetical protein